MPDQLIAANADLIAYQMEEYKNSDLVVILHCLNSLQNKNYVTFLLLYVLLRENHKITVVCFPSFHNGCNPACKVWLRLRTGELEKYWYKINALWYLLILNQFWRKRSYMMKLTWVFENHLNFIACQFPKIK